MIRVIFIEYKVLFTAFQLAFGTARVQKTSHSFEFY